MDRHIRIFRRLLRLLPADFQADYARDMERTFQAQRRDAQHERGGILRLWFETARDLLHTAPREHLEQVAQDVRYAVRTMARRPGFAAVAVLVLAVGIAATTAVFGVIQAALLSPIPFDEPGRLVAVRELTQEDTKPWELSYVSYVELRRVAASFEGLAAYQRNGIAIGGPDPQLSEAALISANLLDTLRVKPIAGRGFTQAEDGPGGGAVALVGHELARTRFGSAERAAGGVLIIDGRATTVVGVLPESFRFPDDDVQVWLPIGQLADEPWMRNRAVHVALVVGRLRGGVSLDEARAELTAWMNAVQAREPAADPRHRLMVRTLAEQVSADARPALTVLTCAVLLLLVVTCSSVALLLLTRAAGRTNEIAIRLSLGASRGRLARQLLTEALCLAALGAVGGLMAARLMLAFLVRGLEDALPPLVTPVIDGTALAVTVATATTAALVCGLVPATHAVVLVRSSAVRQQRSRRYFVAAQVGVSCVLLVVASLLGRSLDRLLQVDLGFRAERLLVMRVVAPLGGYDQKPGDMTRFYEAVSARVGALHGVAAVTATSRPPVQEGSQGDLTVEGQPHHAAPLALFRRVLPGYFTTLGIPIVEGRDFTDRDGTGEPVVIVSQGLARRVWPRGQALGKRIKVGADREPWVRVIGVVADVRNGTLESGADVTTYEPHRQRPWNGMIMMIRTTGDPASMTGAVRRALREVEPQVLISDVSTMEERIEETVASRRFHATLVGAFAAATLILVALALYGVLSYSVTSRTREIGIRSAMGATASVLTREALIEGLHPALMGLALGLAGGGIAASAMRTLLFQVTPADTGTYVGTAAVLLVVAVGSSWPSARRAARVDASTALRSE